MSCSSLRRPDSPSASLLRRAISSSPCEEVEKAVSIPFQLFCALFQLCFERFALFGERSGARARLLKALAQLFELLCRVLLFRLELRPAGGERFALFRRGGDVCLRLLDAALVGEEVAAALPAGTARHGTAGGDDVSVQRDDAEGVRVLFRDVGGVGDVVGDEGVADEVIDDVVVIFVVADELVRKADRTLLFQGAAGVFRFVTGFERLHGEESDLPAAGALQILDEFAGVV